VRLISVLIGIVMLAAALWAAAGYLSTMPLGAVYGWLGHPAIPAAPGYVYALLYLVVLPAVALYIAWRLLWRFARSRSAHGD
jgi:hypothetical protein